MEVSLINQYEEDLSSIQFIEDSLDRLIQGLHLGFYDESFHNQVIKDARELKISILKNDAYREEEKRNLSLLINSYFKVAAKEIRDLAEVSNFL